MNPTASKENNSCDFPHQIITENDIFSEKTHLFLFGDDSIPIEEFFDRLDGDELPATLEEFIHLNEHNGAPRNVKMAALVLMGSQYTEVAEVFGISITRTRSAVLKTIAKVMPKAARLSVGAMRTWRRPILEKLVARFT